MCGNGGQDAIDKYAEGENFFCWVDPERPVSLPLPLLMCFAPPFSFLIRVLLLARYRVLYLPRIHTHTHAYTHARTNAHKRAHARTNARAERERERETDRHTHTHAGTVSPPLSCWPPAGLLLASCLSYLAHCMHTRTASRKSMYDHTAYPLNTC